VLTLARVGRGNSSVIAENGRSRSAVGAGELGPWNIDYDSSYLRFVATQAGADINGEWQQWSAEIRFYEEQLDEGLFDISIMPAAIAMLGAERDATLKDLGWIDAKSHPEVRFQASDFRRNAAGDFGAAGILTIKDRRTPVTLTFTVVGADGHYVLDGQAELDRLALQAGYGEGPDTRWIGQFVTVVVHIDTLD